MSGKAFNRKGLHRVTCDACGGFIYSTVAQLEARGLPRCGWCDNGSMEPERLELAMELGVDHPLRAEFEGMVARKINAQRPHAQRPCRMSDHYASTGDLMQRALNEIRENERDLTVRRMARARRPVMEPEAIPF